MKQYTIDPSKEGRLQKFLAGKGVKRCRQVTTLALSDGEVRSLMRKGFEAYVKPATASKAEDESDEPERRKPGPKPKGTT